MHFHNVISQDKSDGSPGDECSLLAANDRGTNIDQIRK